MFIVDKFTFGASFILFYVAKGSLQRLLVSTPLIEGFEHPITDRKNIRVVKRKRVICGKVGHMWRVVSIVSYSETEPNVYTVRCSRCFPHIHSQVEISSYNPFPYSESTENEGAAGQ